MNEVLTIADADLYSGPDIENAFLRSSLGRVSSETEGVSRLAPLSLHYGSLRRARLRPRHCLVRGRERDSNETMSIRFSGLLRMARRRAGEILGTSQFELVELPARRLPACDLVVTDHPWTNRRLHSARPMHLPKWIRQELQIGASWEETLAHMPAKLHNKLVRLLRRYRYTAAFDGGFQARREFYRRLLVPYTDMRFGDESLLPDERVFLHETRGSTRIDLLHDGEVVGTSLVDIEPPRIAIVRTALPVGTDGLRGRFEILDFFCLLLAQLTGCGVLDFGRSFPHAEDGALRYKAKWGTRIVHPGGREPPTCISVVQPSAAALAFLRRNYFVQRTAAGLGLRVLADAGSDQGCIDRLQRLTRSVALPRVELAHSPGAAESLSRLVVPPGIRLTPIVDSRDPLYRAAGNGQ